MFEYPSFLFIGAVGTAYVLWLHRRRRRVHAPVAFAPVFLLKSESTVRSRRLSEILWLAARITAVLMASLSAARFLPSLKNKGNQRMAPQASIIVTDNLEALSPDRLASLIHDYYLRENGGETWLLDRFGRMLSANKYSSWRARERGTRPDTDANESVFLLPPTLTGGFLDTSRLLSRAANLARRFGDRDVAVVLACRLDITPPADAVTPLFQESNSPYFFPENCHLIITERIGFPRSKAKVGEWLLDEPTLRPGRPVRLKLPAAFFPPDTGDTAESGKISTGSSLSSNRDFAAPPAARLRVSLRRRVAGSREKIVGTNSEGKDYVVKGDWLRKTAGTPAGGLSGEFQFILSLREAGEYVGGAEIKSYVYGKLVVPLVFDVRRPPRAVIFIPGDDSVYADRAVRAIRAALDVETSGGEVRIFSGKTFQPDKAAPAEIVVVAGAALSHEADSFAERVVAAGGLLVVIDAHRCEKSLAGVAGGIPTASRELSPEPHALLREKNRTGGSWTSPPAGILDTFADGRNGNLLNIRLRMPVRVETPRNAGEILLHYGGRNGAAALWTRKVGSGRVWWTTIGFDRKAAAAGDNQSEEDVSALVLLREIFDYHRRRGLPVLRTFATDQLVRIPLLSTGGREPLSPGHALVEAVGFVPDGFRVGGETGNFTSPAAQIATSTGKYLVLRPPLRPGWYLAKNGEMELFLFAAAGESSLKTAGGESTADEWIAFAGRHNSHAGSGTVFRLETAGRMAWPALGLLLIILVVGMTAAYRAGSVLFEAERSAGESPQNQGPARKPEKEN